MAKDILTNDEFEKSKPQVFEFLRKHSSIVSWEFRELTGLNQDKAIVFLNRMVAEGSLLRVGKTSGTKYIAAARVN